MAKAERHPMTGSVSLSVRQEEVLRLVAEGLTNREIAEHLGISIRTAEVHRFNLMKRLQVGNVAQLLHEALRHRVLPSTFLSRQSPPATASGTTVQPGADSFASMPVVDAVRGSPLSVCSGNCRPPHNAIRAVVTLVE